MQTVLGYIKGQSVTVNVAPIGGNDVDGKPLLLRVDAADAFKRMKADAFADGIQLKANYAFRDMATQTELRASYDAGTGSKAAMPGYSNHQQGLAVDIESGGYSGVVYQWLNAYAVNYGFKNTVSGEPWHWEYTL